MHGILSIWHLKIKKYIMHTIYYSDKRSAIGSENFYILFCIAKRGKGKKHAGKHEKKQKNK
ncbi:hypothetical protein KP07_02910 [Candidatus Liberibacter solanacearum]|nr:hypothetical protein KP07_02910 [Candidatus Liberibacter solanacearum]